MPRRHLHVTAAADAPLSAALRALRTQLAIPESFPPAVLAEAEAAAKAPHLPAYDATDIPFFTIDPPTSRDLDQAMHLARRPEGGYRVHYAIADVAAFVAPGGALDAEAHRRATTLYLPDGKVPLHPPVLSEGAASLLPGNTAPALLWRIDLDAEGRQVAVDVRRALVRSVTKLDYAGAQAQIDAGTAEEPLALLAAVGPSGSGWRSNAAASPSTCPNRRSPRPPASTRSTTGSRCPSTAGTPRSPCSPEWSPPT